MSEIECHGLDTPERVCFYEQDFYVLSNFSAFTVYWSGMRFDTSEALYHWLKFASGLGKFVGHRAAIAESIRTARSAHEAFKIAQEHKSMRRDDWDEVKVVLMKENVMTDPTNPFAPRVRDAMHEADCPMQSPHPTACCNCGNPKAIKWNEAEQRFVDPYHKARP